MHQHRFGLIVGVVRHGNRLAVLGERHFEQEAVTHLPRRFFEREFVMAGKRRDVARFDRVGQVPVLRDVAHEVRIGLRFVAAQLMIEMSDVQPQIKFRSERAQRVQQAQRIGSARHADDNRRAAREQIVFGDEAAKTRQEDPS